MLGYLSFCFSCFLEAVETSCLIAGCFITSVDLILYKFCPKNYRDFAPAQNLHNLSIFNTNPFSECDLLNLPEAFHDTLYWHAHCYALITITYIKKKIRSCRNKNKERKRLKMEQAKVVDGYLPEWRSNLLPR